MFGSNGKDLFELPFMFQMLETSFWGGGGGEGMCSCVSISVYYIADFIKKNIKKCWEKRKVLAECENETGVSSCWLVRDFIMLYGITTPHV